MSVIGLDDARFIEELRAARADVSLRRRKASDLVFLGVEKLQGIAELGELERYLKRDGAVWAVFPRGRRDVRDADVIVAGVAAGFVDNKVVRFSDTHTALRFVIPVARR